MLGSFDNDSGINRTLGGLSTWARHVPPAHILITSPPLDPSNFDAVPPQCWRAFVDAHDDEPVYDCGLGALVVFPRLCTEEFLSAMHTERWRCVCRFFVAMEMAARWFEHDARYKDVRWLVNTDDDVYLHLPRARYALRTLGASRPECASSSRDAHDYTVRHAANAASEPVAAAVDARRSVHGFVGAQRLMSRATMRVLLPLLRARRWVELNRSFAPSGLGIDELLTVLLASTVDGVRECNAMSNGERVNKYALDGSNANTSMFWHHVYPLPTAVSQVTFKSLHAAVGADNDARREAPFDVPTPTFDARSGLYYWPGHVYGLNEIVPVAIAVNAPQPFVSFAGDERSMRDDGLAMRARDLWSAHSLAQLTTPLAVRDLFDAAESRAFVEVRAANDSDDMRARIVVVPSTPLAAVTRAARDDARLIAGSVIIGTPDAVVAALLGYVLRHGASGRQRRAYAHLCDDDDGYTVRRVVRLLSVLWLNGASESAVCVSARRDARCAREAPARVGYVVGSPARRLKRALMRLRRKPTSQ